MATKRKRTVACDVCRERKVKCNGELPCTNCLDRGEKCFLTDKKQRRRLHAGEDDPLTQRLSRIEALLDGKSGHSPEARRISRETPIMRERENQTTQTHQNRNESWTNSASTLASLKLPPERTTSSHEDGSVYSAEMSNLEYVGPRTFLSVCSTPAISWISSRLGNDSFQSVAAQLLRDITRRLSPSQSVPLQRKPDPSAEDAWRYTEAYFNEAPEAPFGVVNRAKFEAHLRKHFNASRPIEHDSAWYALRNVIFAYGSRALLSKTSTFHKANEESHGWFYNALAVHTDLLYFRTSIVGVLALTVMAYYTEGLGGPSLQHMLVACTVRLAFAKGLHRQACPSWKLHPDEAAHRNWIFWAIYCLDKHIAVRSGRPSAIDDDEVNCPIPTTSTTGNPANVWYCTTTVNMSTFLSRISKELSSAKGMAKSPEKTLDRIRVLDRELQTLVGSVRHVMDLENPSGPIQMAGLTTEQALRIRLMYFEVVFALHSTISRPWLRLVCPKQVESAPYQEQVLSSMATGAMASKSVILACAQMHLDGQCSHWTALTVPLTACINLFIHILQDPHRESTQSDLSLLDVSAGHFARLDFATRSAVSHSFVRECAQLARSMVVRAEVTENIDAESPQATRRSDQPSLPMPTSDPSQELIVIPDDFDLDTWFNMELWLPIEF